MWALATHPHQPGPGITHLSSTTGHVGPCDDNLSGSPGSGNSGSSGVPGVQGVGSYPKSWTGVSADVDNKLQFRVDTDESVDEHHTQYGVCTDI